MTIRKILTEPNKILREKSLRVENVDKDIQQLMDDMLETLYAAPGIGLAAIQIGVDKRVIIMDIAITIFTRFPSERRWRLVMYL